MAQSEIKQPGMPLAAAAEAAAVAYDTAPLEAPRRALVATGSSDQQRIGFSQSLGLYALLAPTFILLAVFSLVPFAVAFITSFYEYEVGGASRFIGLSNYAEYFHDYTFLESFGNMLLLTAFSVVMVMIVPLVVAKLVNQRTASSGDP